MSRTLLLAIAFAACAHAQSVADQVSKAHQEVSDFLKAGGKISDPAHPAEKWARELWKWRDTAPGTPDAAKATTEAIRLLVYADRFNDAESRVDGIHAKLQGRLQDAAAQVAIGRAYRRQHDEQKAEAFRAAINLSPESPSGKEAETQL